MFVNILKITLRNLFKRKFFSLLNIVGLGLGMAAFILIFRYVAFEFSYENLHPEAENIYAVGLKRQQPTGSNEYFSVPSPIKEHVLADLPELEQLTRINGIDYQNNSLIYEKDGQIKTESIRKGVYFTEPDLGNIFNFPLASGSYERLAEPNHLILSHQKAINLFGSEDPVGKTLILSNNVGKFNYKVVGVLQPLPKNTHFHFGALLSYASNEANFGIDPANDWQRWTDNFFIKIAADSDPVSIQSKIRERLISLKGFSDNPGEWDVQMVSLPKVHFSSINHGMFDNNGDLGTTQTLALIGFCILLIAWINYINLATARSMERSKEVGVRKVLGSTRGLLRLQFVTEALVLNVASLLLALAFVQWAIPFLKDFTNPMVISEAQQLSFWGFVLATVLIGALLAGAYPAFILSNHKPAEVIKGGDVSKRPKGFGMRKALVVVQYTASVVMLAGAITIQKQLDFMFQKDLGIETRNVIILDAPPGALNGESHEFFASLKGFKNEVQQLPDVVQMTTSNAVPGKSINWGGRIGLQGEDEKKSVSLIACDPDFLETYQIGLLGGRFYKETDDTFGEGQVVINEALADALGFDDPQKALGEQLSSSGMFAELTVVGVTKNHNHESLKEDYYPIAYVKSVWSNYYSIQLTPKAAQDKDKMAELLPTLQGLWESHFLGAPFTYEFADDTYRQQYRPDEDFHKIINLFTLLTILIASLGLWGLSAYNLVLRTKEMGIRKILGATPESLLVLLSGSFVPLLVIAGVIALPLSWWLMERWLSDYAFRIDLGIWIAIIPLGLILLIGCTTIALQTLKAVRANPVQALRSD